MGVKQRRIDESPYRCPPAVEAVEIRVLKNRNFVKGKEMNICVQSCRTRGFFSMMLFLRGVITFKVEASAEASFEKAILKIGAAEGWAQSLERLEGSLEKV